VSGDIKQVNLIRNKNANVAAVPSNWLPSAPFLCLEYISLYDLKVKSESGDDMLAVQEYHHSTALFVKETSRIKAINTLLL
jgi:hypothetical protein